METYDGPAWRLISTLVEYNAGRAVGGGESRQNILGGVTLQTLSSEERLRLGRGNPD